MNKQKASSVSASVMTAIKSGEVRMKPRVYYTLVGALSVSVVVLIGIIATYLSSIVFFWIRIQTADTMAFGARARLSESLASFPWWALFAAALLMTLAVSLVRRYGQMYKHKTSTVAVALILGSLLLGLLASFLDNGMSRAPSRPNGNYPGQSWRQNR